MCDRRKHSHGFSLLELVIVVVILGIIAAVAVPRMSRGSAGAADAALTADLAVMRNAIDLFGAEHNGDLPTLANIENQLTQYTDAAGAALPARDATHIYGPYLRKVPPQKVGPEKGKTGFTDVAGTANFGWVYNETTGEVKPNTTTEKDAANTLYSDY